MSGAVYGDMLAAFAELFAEYTVFDMKALPAGKYGPMENQRAVFGVYRRVPSGKLSVQAENREKNQVGTFWCYAEDGKRIGQSAYMLVDSDVYIVMKDNGYENEGGFNRFTVCRVPGYDGRQKEDATVKEKFLGDFK